MMENERTERDVMLAIEALDPSVCLKVSSYTGMWYIASNLEISNGLLLSGVTEHQETAGRAVLAFVARLKNIKDDEVVVARPYGKRRHYRWNGAVFAEQPMWESAQVANS